MRHIVVGDPHGCLEEFKELLDLVKFTRGEDDLVVAGDVFDRGPYSVELLRYIKDIGATLVMGNHDDKHLRYAQHELKKKSNPHYKNPMKAFYGVRQAIQDALTPVDIAFMEACPRLLKLDKSWVVVHAGMEDKPLNEQGREILRVRYVDNDTGLMTAFKGSFEQPPNSVYWTERWKGPQNVLYGHAVHSLELPRKTSHNGVITIGLDTGCCFGGRLSAAIIKDDKFVDYASVKAKKKYKEFTKDSHKE
jgi:bis(5'-nucleosyl)-tetraphosphatase (symmetrical)